MPGLAERRDAIVTGLELTRQVRHEVRGHEVRDDQLVALDLLGVLLHRGLGVEMLNLGELPAAELLGVRQRTPDEVPHLLVLARVDDVLALLQLRVLVHRLPVVGHGEDAVRARDRLLDALHVVEVRLRQLRPARCECLRARLARVARDRPDLVFGCQRWVVEHRRQCAAALVACGSEDGQDLLGHDGYWVAWEICGEFVVMFEMLVSKVDRMVYSILCYLLGTGEWWKAVGNEDGTTTDLWNWRVLREKP